MALFRCFLVVFALAGGLVGAEEPQVEAERALERYGVPGMAVGVVVDGEVVFLEGFGRKNERGERVTPDTLFAVGSQTKGMTCEVLAQLVSEGKVNWDDRVIDYVPELRFADGREEVLTVRHLVTHSSGMPRHDLLWYQSKEGDGVSAIAKHLERFAHLDPVCKVGERFLYNNWMFGVASLVTERIEGKPWEMCMRERVFKPLGIEANFSKAEFLASDDFSLAYSKRGEIPFLDLSVLGGAGAVNASCRDMVKWIAYSIEHTPTDVEIKVEKEFRLRGQKLLGYSRGWFVGDFHGEKLLYHGGSTRGFMTLGAFLPERKLGVVVLTNTDAAHLEAVRAVATGVLEHYMGIESVELPLEAYVGCYEHAGYGKIKISEQEGRLFFEYGRLSTPLDRKEGDSFVGASDVGDWIITGLPFKFVRDACGGVVELRVKCEPMLDPIIFDFVGNGGGE